MIKVTDALGTRIIEHQIMGGRYFEGTRPFTLVVASEDTFVPGNGSIEIEYCEAE